MNLTYYTLSFLSNCKFVGLSEQEYRKDPKSYQQCSDSLLYIHALSLSTFRFVQLISKNNRLKPVSKMLTSAKIPRSNPENENVLVPPCPILLYYFWKFSQDNAPVLFSAYSHVSYAIYNVIPFLAVKTTTISEPENQTRATSEIIYISLGITSSFLLLSVAIVIWCYRRKKERLLKGLCIF